MNKKLLLVEDHEMNREMLTRRLVRLGFDVLVAVDGEEAIEVTNAEVPDLILMDLSLPVIDGFETTRRIKADARTRDIPIIALTAYVHEFDKNRAMKAGCDEYETKPVDMLALVDKINTLLNQARAVV